MRSLPAWVLLTVAGVFACGGVESASSPGATPAEATTSAGDPGASQDGGDTLLTSNLASVPMRMIASGSALYWVDAVGALWTLPSAGGQPSRLAEGKLLANPLIVAGDRVYFADKQHLYAMPLEGGTQETIVERSKVGSRFEATIRDGVLFWVESDLGTQENLVFAKTLATGNVTNLGNVPGMEVEGLAATQTSIVVDAFATSYFPRSGISSGWTPQELPCCAHARLFAASSEVYCVPTKGVVARVTDSGEVTNLASDIRSTCSAEDDGSIYWGTNDAAGSIYRTSKAGGEAVRLRSHPAQALAVDPTYLYWATTDGSILRARK